MKSDPDELALTLIEYVAARCDAEPGTEFPESEQRKLEELLEDVVSNGQAIRALRDHLRLSGQAPPRLSNRLPEIAQWIKDRCDDVVQDLTNVETSRESVTTVAMTVAGTGGAGTATAMGAVIAGGAASAGPVFAALVATGGIAGPVLFGGGLLVYVVQKQKSARNKRIIAGAQRLSEAIANRDNSV